MTSEQAFKLTQAMHTLYYPRIRNLPLPAGHRFPGGKYRMLLERFEARPLANMRLDASPLANRTLLMKAHDAAYVDAMLSGAVTSAAMKRIGLPWSEVLMQRSRATVGGTLAAARAALVSGFSGQLAGGTHHAHKGHGSGFCVFNDIAVAALVLLEEGIVARIAVLDLDVHQGDGTAAVLRDEPRAFTCSVHGAGNFPFEKATSSKDVALATGTGDAAYLTAVNEALSAVLAFDPDLVFYLSGADALASDRLGRLEVSAEALRVRDGLVFSTLNEIGIACAVAVGGGYADPIEATVDVYEATFREAARIFVG